MTNNVKVLILGDSASGKTTLVKRIMNEPIENIYITFGVDFFQKKNKDTLVQMYDAGGNNKLFDIISIYLKNIDIIILTYDVSNRKNFKSIDKWINNIKCYSKPILLIGNKKDSGKNYIPKIPKDILDMHNIIGHEIISCFNNYDYHVILEHIDNFSKNKYCKSESDEEDCFKCCFNYF
jgi:small GTP-binding protein